MWRHAIVIGMLVLPLTCSWSQAGEATVSVTVSARVNSFAEWSVSEAPASVTTAANGHSLHIEQPLTLFANTDVTLTLTPGVNGGVLTAANGEVLQTTCTLAGDVVSAIPAKHAGVGNVYRVRHLPGRGAYQVVLELRAAASPIIAIHSGKCTTSIRRAGHKYQRADAMFEVIATGEDLPVAKTYRGGYSITVSW